MVPPPSAGISSGRVLSSDTNGDGTTYGRGTANIAGLNFASTSVDASRVKSSARLSRPSIKATPSRQQKINYDVMSLKATLHF